MTQLFANNAQTTTTAELSFSATSMNVLDGSSFPIPDPGNEHFLVTLHDAEFSSYEVVYVSVRSANVFTIVRGHEGTQAIWPVGTFVSANVTEKTMINLQQGVDSAYSAASNAQTDATAALLQISQLGGGTGATVCRHYHVHDGEPFGVNHDETELWDMVIVDLSTGLSQYGHSTELYPQVHSEYDPAQAQEVDLDHPIHIGYTPNEIDRVRIWRNGMLQPRAGIYKYTDMVGAVEGEDGWGVWHWMGPHQVHFYPPIDYNESITVMGYEAAEWGSPNRQQNRSFQCGGFADDPGSENWDGDNTYNWEFSWITFVAVFLNDNTLVVSDKWRGGGGGTTDGIYGRIFGTWYDGFSGDNWRDTWRMTIATESWTEYQNNIVQGSNKAGCFTDGTDYSWILFTGNTGIGGIGVDKYNHGTESAVAIANLPSGTSTEGDAFVNPLNTYALVMGEFDSGDLQRKQKVILATDAMSETSLGTNAFDNGSAPMLLAFSDNKGYALSRNQKFDFATEAWTAGILRGCSIASDVESNMESRWTAFHGDGGGYAVGSNWLLTHAVEAISYYTYQGGYRNGLGTRTSFRTFGESWTHSK